MSRSRKGGERIPWVPEHLEVLRRAYPHNSTGKVAKVLGRTERAVYAKALSMGLHKTDEYLGSPDAGRLSANDRRGLPSRFKPGGKSWNKGIKGSTGLHPNCQKTQFKKGRRPEEAANYQPIGATRLSCYGHLEQKITDDPALPPAHRWKPVSRVVWEAANGPIPAGHAVVFRAGRKTTDAEMIVLDALELVTRAELMKRNSYHNRYPKEVARLIQLRGAINRQINKRNDK